MPEWEGQNVERECQDGETAKLKQKARRKNARRAVFILMSVNNYQK